MNENQLWPAVLDYVEGVIDADLSSGYSQGSTTQNLRSSMGRARPKHNILLVNGTATVQNLRILMLRMRGYTVHGALSLDEARQLIKAKPYSLVIVDVGHFAGPGLEFCEEVRRLQPHQKVMLQVEDNLLPLSHECPDKVIPKQEGPHAFVSEVEKMLTAGAG